MAFREQHGFDLTEERLRFLEDHPMCVHSMIVLGSVWEFSAHRSAGRLFRIPEYGANFPYTLGDLVFVSYRPNRPTALYRRLAFFRYRGDITQALKEATVAEVMKS